MKQVNRFGATLIMCALLVALSGCEKEGVAEKAGKKMDDAAETVGEKVEDAGDALKDVTN